MKDKRDRIKPLYSLLIGTMLIMTACTQMSELETDPEAGLNGGFEIVKNGLPVNWLMYTPQTVPDSDFTIELDENEFKEGERSLKFDIKECSSAGGWRSPGFTNEFFTAGKFEGKNTYKVSFWVKNHDTTFRISSGGVSPNKGNMKILIESDEEINDWKYFEYDVDVAEDMWLRMQLNILELGTFWIDDLSIEKI